jgi:sugar phosphate isomerase/epimerase
MVGMKIGAMNHPARNPLYEIAWSGRQEIDFVDFTLEPPGADRSQIDAVVVRAALDRQDLGVVAHAVWLILIRSPFASVREASLAEFRRALRAAHQIGATVMNVHHKGP